MNVNVIAIITSRPDTDATLQIEVKKLVTATLTEEGCLAYEIYENMQQKGQYYIIELWQDDAALVKHRQMPYYKYFHHIAPALLAQPVEINTLTRLV